MGGTRYDDATYTARVAYRSATGTHTFEHDHDIKSGKKSATVADRLKPYGVTLRESRDSGANIKVPIILTLDTTGSMGAVPAIIQKQLPALMGGFLKDKASGKSYLGDNGYPDILISAVDDYFAQGPDGAVQLGQFESGIEIDDDITNLWITGNGGGNAGESYDLMMYFAARNTQHDHWDKRGRKGYLIFLADEPVFGEVSARAVNPVFGHGLQSDIPIKQIVAELSERYHVFCGIPTDHDFSGRTRASWSALLGDEHVISFDPSKVCEFIVGVVAMVESTVELDDLISDGVISGGLSKALAPLAKAATDLQPGVGMPDLPVLSGGGKGGKKRL